MSTNVEGQSISPASQTDRMLELLDKIVSELKSLNQESKEIRLGIKELLNKKK